MTCLHIASASFAIHGTVTEEDIRRLKEVVKEVPKHEVVLKSDVKEVVYEWSGSNGC
jgi:phosphoribosylformimino-5-aminoimidazole carboxamide ribonucleotide (ProFAR) isomerase